VSPLRGILGRLVGGKSTDNDAGDDRSPDEQRSRRRGRRGGRNRNRNRNNGEGGGGGDAGSARAQTTERAPERTGRNDGRQQQSSRSNRSSKEDTTTTSTPTRRRGRRGGRGRNGNRNDNQTQNKPEGQTDSRQRSSGSGQRRDSDSRDYSWGKKSGRDSAAREAQQERRDRAAQRSGRGRRRYSPSQLDAPLPEDIAFRAADEGGDRSILPARRRPPPGLRDTSRVIIGGARSLSGFVREAQPPATVPQVQPSTPEPGTEEPDAVAQEPEARVRRRPAPVKEVPDRDETDDTDETNDSDDAAEATVEVDENVEETDTDDATSDRPRRRRGRRGGRGRRRRSEPASAEDDQPDTDPADEDDDADAGEGDDEGDDAGERDQQPAAERQTEPETDSQAQPERPASGELPEAFRALGLTNRTLESLADFGFVEPTPIQEQAIPLLLDNRDVVGLAQTGSGKTVAFGAPMVERLDPQLAEVQAIVLVPTRELAQQVLDVIDRLADPYDIKVVGLLGGRALQKDFAALDSGPQVVVGTPGRIIDHLRRGTLSLRGVGYAVLDEADQMLDIGFLPDIRRILGRTPKRRQTCLFSATMPTSIRRLVWQFMDDPETVTVDPELTAVESIEQIYYEVAHRDKTRGLRELVERELKGRTLVFCNTRRGVDRLADQLQHDGVQVGALHGDMDQRRRDRVVEDFRKGQLDILIATNVAARGIDIPEITHVVNFDVPQNAEEYIHRTGRTGRAGRDGKAITFVSEWDLEGFDPLLEQFGEDLQKETLELYG
jgi:superfamily II DNA/RNA helicase